MKLRRLIPLLLAVLMVAAIVAACTQSPGTATEAPTKAAATQAPDDGGDDDGGDDGGGEETTTPGAPDPITFTSGGDYTSDGISDSLVAAVLTEITGVTINQIIYDGEKMKVLAAAGDLPDMPKLYTIPDIATFVRNQIDVGALVQLDDLLAEHGQAVLAQAPLAINYANNVFNDGNGTYFTPKALVYPLETPNKNGTDGGFTVRWDVYKAVGAPELDGEDSLIDLLADMQEAYPTAPNGNKAWGLSWFEDWGAYWPAGSWSSHTAWDRGHMNQARLDVGEYKRGDYKDGWLDRDSNTWSTIRFFNKAYLAGVFDPDGLSMKWNSYSEKAKNGEILTGQANYMNPDVNLVGDDNAILVYAKGMSDYLPGIWGNESPLGWNAANSWCISSNCADPVRAMQWFNYLASDDGGRVHYNGRQGEDWDYVDGVPVLLGKRLDFVLSGGKENVEYVNDQLKIGPFGLFGPPRQGHSRAVGDEYPYNLASSYEYVLAGLTPGEKDYVQFMCEREGWDPEEVRTPGEVYAKWVEQGDAQTFPTDAFLGNSFMPADTPEFAEIVNDCTNYIAERTAELVLAKSEEEFYSVVDKTIEVVKSKGYESYKEEFLRRVSVSREVAASMGG